MVEEEEKKTAWGSIAFIVLGFCNWIYLPFSLQETSAANLLISGHLIYSDNSLIAIIGIIIMFGEGAGMFMALILIPYLLKKAFSDFKK